MLQQRLCCSWNSCVAAGIATGHYVTVRAKKTSVKSGAGLSPILQLEPKPDQALAASAACTGFSRALKLLE